MMKLFGVRYYLLSLVIIATCNVVGMEPKDRTDFRLSLAPKAELFFKTFVTIATADENKSLTNKLFSLNNFLNLTNDFLRADLPFFMGGLAFVQAIFLGECVPGPTLITADKIDALRVDQNRTVKFFADYFCKCDQNLRNMDFERGHTNPFITYVMNKVIPNDGFSVLSIDDPTERDVLRKAMDHVANTLRVTRELIELTPEEAAYSELQRVTIDATAVYIGPSLEHIALGATVVNDSLLPAQYKQRLSGLVAALLRKEQILNEARAALR